MTGAGVGPWCDGPAAAGFRKGENIMELGEGLKKILLAGIGTAAVKAQIESMQAEAAAKEEEVPVAEPVEDAATETVEEEKTEAAGGSEEAPEAE